MTDLLRTLFGIESAAKGAERFEALFWYMTAVMGTVGLLVYFAIFVFCVKYRRTRAQGPTPRLLGSHALEITWTIIPLVVFLSFFAWGAINYNEAAQPPPDAMQVDVIGKQWMWKAQYHPGGQRVIIGMNNDTDPTDPGVAREGGELWLPVNKPVRFKMISEDVIHDFGLPAFRTKMDVLPGRYTFQWVHPTKVGLYEIFCDQYCGTNHSRMAGKVRVVPQEDFDAWLQGRTPSVPAAKDPGRDTRGPVDGSPASEGQQLFRVKNCINCHTPGAGTGNGTHPRAPTLEGLYGAIAPIEGGGTAEVNEQYLRESILHPRKKVVEGWKPIMPAYEGKMSAQELNNLVEYIKWLRTGRVIPPTQVFPPPDGAPQRGPSEQQPKSPSGTSSGTGGN